MSDVQLRQGSAFKLLIGIEDNSAAVGIVDYPWTFINGDRPGRANLDDPEEWKMNDNNRFRKAIEEVARIVKPGGYVYAFADGDVLPAFRRAVEDALTYRKTLIWSTERIGNGHYFRSCHSYVICATVGETDRYVQSTPTVLKHPAPQREPGESPQYPTEKPASLYRDLISPVVERGERVLEPFCGSAPGLEVAKSLECDYWGCDTSEDAISRAENRLGQASVRDF